MRANITSKIFKWILRVVLAIVSLLVLLIIAIYIPPVQDFALKKVLTSVNADPSRHVEVGRFRLYPPLHIEAGDVIVTENSDTMATVGQLSLRVNLLPLIKGKAGVDNLDIENVRFNLGAPDSLMYLRSAVDNGLIKGVTVGLLSHEVDVDLISVSGTRVLMDLQPDTTATDTVSVSTPLPWKINVSRFSIDSLSFGMTMPPTIDTLGVNIPSGLIEDATIDLSSSAIDVKALTVDSITARYLTPPTDGTPAPAPVEVTDTATTSSTPWAINVGSIHLTASDALYGVRGATPLPGLDMEHLEVSRVDIVIDSLYNCGTTLRVPIKRIYAHERCGLDMTLTGMFTMDSDSLNATAMHLSTLYSAIDLNAMMGMKSSGLPMPMYVRGSGYISPNDISLAMPAMRPMLAGIPATSLLDLNIDVTGDNGLYDITDLSLTLPRCFDIAAKGSVAGLPEVSDLEGRLTLTGHIANGRWVRPGLVAARLDKTVTVPPLSLRGNVLMHAGTVKGALNAVTGRGRIALDAGWTARSEGYDLSLKATDFPVDAFMPTLGVEKVSATVDAHGHGYDPFNSKTGITSRITVSDVTYNHRRYSDIDMSATVADGRGSLSLTSGNPSASFDIRADGNLSTTPYDWTLRADVTNLDLKAMGMTDSVMQGSVNMHGHAVVTPGRDGSMMADLDIADLDWKMSGSHIATTGLKLHFLGNDSLTSASIHNKDLVMNLSAPMGIDSVSARMTRLSGVIDSVMANHFINVDAIQRALPPFTLDMTAGSDNIVNNYLTSAGMGFTGLDLSAGNDSLINMDARVLNFNSGTTVLDTITARVYQNSDTLKYLFHIGNRPGTLDQWTQVSAYGRLVGNHASILVNQQNIDGLTGYRLGFIGEWRPDEITVRVVPHHPVIGYKTWTVNDSNFVSLNTLHRHFDADLAMSSSESSIHLYTDHAHRTDSLQEDLILNIKDIKLQEWLALNPFAPPVTGSVSADMRFGWGDKAINGSGTVSLADLTYGKERVGSFDLGLDLSTNASGTVRASAALMVDSIKTITAEGNLNDSTARNPFLLDFNMIHFPLNILNPFLPKDMARLNGTLNGTMDITGSLAEPVFNGYLDFDSTSLTIPMFGTTYRFSDRRIPMDSNIVSFDNFTIASANENPLSINGTVDARHISDIHIDLTASGHDMQLVNSKKGRNVQVYGKAFADLDASVKGTLSRMDINADLAVLENTNVTYIMESATDNLSSRSNIDMVKFVNFADTTVVEREDSIASSSMMMRVDAILRVNQGSVISVDLSTDGKNRVQLLSSGSLNYNMNYMGDSRLTGRLNLNGGFVRYTPPFMSEKLFNFQEGSYTSFNGNMMNPYLNVKAIDVLRANVQQDGQNSRLINFDVILTVTNSLENMDIAFDLSTNDDITVANELQSMTPEQRANQAMNLLLYNVYTGPGTRASSSLNGNPLFSFLESQVNSWAANNIKGVDLSFGIDQYDRTVNGASSTTTSYSYKVSKSLFNDRFKISVGGNYASDADADENLSQNLINDISFEYDITPSGSMYVKIFRHTGYESILEGEVTQTGVGFVYKRKLRRLRDLFSPLYRRPKQPVVKQVDDKTQENDADPQTIGGEK